MEDVQFIIWLNNSIKIVENIEIMNPQPVHLIIISIYNLSLVHPRSRHWIIITHLDYYLCWIMCKHNRERSKWKICHTLISIQCRQVWHFFRWFFQHLLLFLLLLFICRKSVWIIFRWRKEVGKKGWDRKRKNNFFYVFYVNRDKLVL